MDLREIQRLHAQFAPDSMTIDLPRQIAALPVPKNCAAEGTSTKPRSALIEAGPVVRSCAAPVLIAAAVALAGMGAAKIYRSVGASTNPHPAVEKTTTAVQPVTASDAGVRPKDATPARPVAGAPMLSASDLDGAPTVGLTADKFRNSLGTNSTNGSGKGTVGKPAPAISNETQLAAVSPIRQSRRDSEPAHAAAPTVAPAQPESKPSASNAVQSVAQPSTTTTAPASAADRGASEVTTRSHSYRHHVSRARDEPSAQGDAPSAASNKKPVPANRAGANEVQMF